MNLATLEFNVRIEFDPGYAAPVTAAEIQRILDQRLEDRIMSIEVDQVNE